MQQINETLSDAAPPVASIPLRVTASAIARVAKLLADEPPGTQFWVGVDGGGCSGFQYKFDLVARAVSATDYIIEENGAIVAVDDVSQPYLAGSELDYVEDLARAGFEIRNPNATAKCGCGNSFSVPL